MLDGLLTRTSEAYAYVYFGSVIAVALAEAAAPRRRAGNTTGLRWLNNIALAILDTVVIRSVFPVAAIGWAALCGQRGWGLLNMFEAPALVSWLLTFVVLDFATYGQHYLLHRIPLLWRLHRTHHSDADYDFSTGLRFHPIEGIFTTSVQFLAIFLLGAPVAAVLVAQLVGLVVAFVEHGNVRIPATVDRAVRKLFVTPDMHRIHHSQVAREGRSNLSNLFSWWDRLFGTYVEEPSAGHAGIVFGLPEFGGRKHTLLPWMLAQPFFPAARPNHEDAKKSAFAKATADKSKRAYG